jgi:hypothetical protein
LVAFFFLGSTGFGVVAERHVVVSPLKLKKHAARGDIPYACAGNRSPLLVSVSSAAAIDGGCASRSRQAEMNAESNQIS